MAPRKVPTKLKPAGGTTRPSGTIARAPQKPAPTPPSAIKPRPGILAPGRPPAQPAPKTSKPPKPPKTVIEEPLISQEEAPTPVSAEEAARRAAQEVENARLQSQRTDWSEYLTQVFNSYGLGSLAPRIREFVQQGYTPDTVTLKLQETPEYQQRFVGNEARRKTGLPVLSPAEYLEVESSYKQIMRTAGLPTGFYDNPDDFAKFIGIDVSPAELKQRVDVAALTLENADPLFKQQLKQFYNLNDGDMIAYALDPERALPTLLRQTQATQFGAEAARQGLQVQRTMAEAYAGLGVTQEQARQGFEQVAQITPEAERLSSVFAGQEEAVGQEDVMSAVFTGEGSAEYQKRLKRLSEMEQSLFAGQSGVGAGSLARGRTGQF
jgi:hypothetical protein